MIKRLYTVISSSPRRLSMPKTWVNAVLSTCCKRIFRKIPIGISIAWIVPNGTRCQALHTLRVLWHAMSRANGASCTPRNLPHQPNSNYIA